MKTENNPKGAGRPKTGNERKTYWTDTKTHSSISELVQARKQKQVSDDELENICSIIRKAVDENLEKLTNQIIGK